MPSHLHLPRPAAFALLVALLFALVLPAASAAHDDAKARSSTPTKLQGGLPLPVFRFLPPDVSEGSAATVADLFDGVYSGQPVQQDEYLSFTRYTIPNTDTFAILEQYGATGGFYAFDAARAFGAAGGGPISADDAEYYACMLLDANELFPGNVVLPDSLGCDFNPATYDFADVRLAHASSETDDAVVAASVRVPMWIDSAAYQSPAGLIPLGGPGGHISLLFRTTEWDMGVPSLDSTVPGLSGIAMPFFGREFVHVGNYPLVDVQVTYDAVYAGLQEAFPGATEIILPNASLAYLVSDAAVRQLALEPMLTFDNIEIREGGETIFLRPISLPATTGFGPEVAITAPANGAQYSGGDTVTFVAEISAGDLPAPPYVYEWKLSDGTILEQSTAEDAGTISFATSALPVLLHDGQPAPVTVHLNVEDGNGAQRGTSVALQPVAPVMSNSLYLPQISQDSRGGRPPAAPLANYSFGLEQASDYPPAGANPEGATADLPGVVGDVRGFRNGMEGMGWDRRFHWSNGSAWEKDWRDCSLGGGDCTYGVDRADFVYYSGHSGPGGLSLPSSVDSTWFDATDARFQNARWVALFSCQALRAQWSPSSEAPIRDWFGAFQGAHMILGFNSNSIDVELGWRFADNMRIPRFFGFLEMPWAQRTIADAWVQTAFQLNAGQPAYLFAIGTNGVNPSLEKLPRANDPLRPRPFPVASYNWVWWE